LPKISKNFLQAFWSYDSAYRLKNALHQNNLAGPRRAAGNIAVDITQVQPLKNQTAVNRAETAKKRTFG
jgi:hypothetical protein